MIWKILISFKDNCGSLVYKIRQREPKAIRPDDVMDMIIDNLPREHVDVHSEVTQVIDDG
jgi:hypothetical protein